MTNPAQPHPPDDPTALELVRIAIRNFQSAYGVWIETAKQPFEHEVARLQLHSAQDQLLSLIADTLLKVARRWIGSMDGRSLASVDDDDALMSLALTLYLDVIEELPKTEIVQSKNPLSLIKTIAHRRMSDRYRRSKRVFAVRTLLRSDDVSVSSDTPEQEIVDPESLNFEEVLVDRLYSEALIEDIWKYWGATLSSEDQKIMRHREKDPPTPFTELAEMLGSGYTEGMVKMRHHRIIERTRNYFRRRQPPPN